MKYKILFDFGSEGFRFEKTAFDDIEKAVKQAIELSRQNCSPFLIVTIVDWKVIES